MTPARKFFLILGGAALLFTLLVVAAAAYVRHQGFIVVRVQESSPHGDDVSVRFPAAFLQAGLPFVPLGRLQRECPQFARNREAFRAVLREVADSPDCDLVSVDSANERVRVTKRGELLIIGVLDGADKVFVSVPVRVLDRFAKWI
jgi:hypothetical protein